MLSAKHGGTVVQEKNKRERELADGELADGELVIIDHEKTGLPLHEKVHTKTGLPLRIAAQPGRR
jgi:hypothetical protein